MMIGFILPPLVGFILPPLVGFRLCLGVFRFSFAKRMIGFRLPPLVGFRLPPLVGFRLCLVVCLVPKQKTNSKQTSFLSQSLGCY